MREIGSEFWNISIIDKENNLFPEYGQWFLSGRSALQSIIHKLRGCHTVAIPSWCCDSMIKPFVDAGFRISFYPVYWQEKLVQEIHSDCDVLFLMDYFGYTSDVSDYSNYNGKIIRDLTHSVFSNRYFDSDYYFGSLRKWCGVWTGGYAWRNDDTKLTRELYDDSGYVALRKQAMELKEEYINGQRNDKTYLKMFEQAEEMLNHVRAAPASDRDVTCAKHLNISSLIDQRRMNAKVLMEAFPSWLMFKQMKENDCPMFVPVMVPNGKRDGLRQYLIENKIYCPIHWPVTELHHFDERTGYIYKNELSLICDQRYTEHDMHRMIDLIINYMED